MATAPKKVPRRMKRFYREAVDEKRAIDEEYGGYESYSYKDEGYTGSLESAVKKVESIPAEERKERAESLPTMEYEDLNIDRKNERELRKIGEKETEEKLALFEIEKFKREKKRMPTRKESGQLAENVFEQMKQEKDIEEQAPSRHERRRRARGREMPADEGKPHREKRRPRRGRKNAPPVPPAPPSGELGSMGDIKSLLGDETGPGKKKLESEMDLGLGELEGGGDMGELKELEFDLEGKKKKKKGL